MNPRSISILALAFTVAPLAADLVGHWDFEEGSGTTTADRSGGGHHGTLRAGVSWDTTEVAPAPSGSTASLFFDGTPDTAAVEMIGYKAPEIGGANARTLAAWVRVFDPGNTNPINRYVWAYGEVVETEKFILRTAGVNRQIRTEVHGGNAVGTSSILGDGEWHHVAVVLANDGSPNQNEVLYYIDGVLDPLSISSDQVVNTDTTNGFDFILGDRPDKNDRDNWHGWIDEVRIYDEALDSDAIMALVVGGQPQSDLSFTIEHDPAGDELTLTWSSQVGKIYDLLSSTDPETDGDPSIWAVVAGQEGIAAAPGNTNTLTIPRPADQVRFYAIREENVPPPEPATAFFDDFESVPNPDWTTGANPGDAGNTVWERGAPLNVGPLSAFDGSTNCFGTNIADDYGPGTDIYLRSPAIDLTTPGLTEATLTFQQVRDTDIDIESDDDFGTVRVLKASDLSSQLGANVVTDVEGADFGVWQNFSATLPPEALGEEIVLEFRFKGDDTALEVFSGWYIDNVTVTTE